MGAWSQGCFRAPGERTLRDLNHEDSSDQDKRQQTVDRCFATFVAGSRKSGCEAKVETRAGDALALEGVVAVY